MKKLIIIILCIGLIGIFLFVFKQKPAPVSVPDNKEQIESLIQYENDKYGYKLAIPGFWKKEDLHEKQILIFQDLDKVKSDLGGYIKIFSSYDEKKDTSVSIQDWWTEHGPQNSRQAPYPDEEKLIKVAGEDAYYTVYDSESNAFGYDKLAAVFIYVGHNGKVYEISGGKLPAKPAERGLTNDEIEAAKAYEKTFQQILESFTFID